MLATSQKLFGGNFATVARENRKLMSTRYCGEAERNLSGLVVVNRAIKERQKSSNCIAESLKKSVFTVQLPKSGHWDALGENLLQIGRNCVQFDIRFPSRISESKAGLERQIRNRDRSNKVWRQTGTSRFPKTTSALNPQFCSIRRYCGAVVDRRALEGESAFFANLSSRSMRKSSDRRK